MLNEKQTRNIFLVGKIQEGSKNNLKVSTKYLLRFTITLYLGL